METLAERLFETARVRGATEDELDDMLDAHQIPHEDTSWDWYDCSLELRDVPNDYRIPPEAQRAIFDAGFAKVYVNHINKWETHYSWKHDAFTPSEGWRVSYPHKRGPAEKGIWVEKRIDNWPAEWFDTGYVLICPQVP